MCVTRFLPVCRKYTILLYHRYIIASIDLQLMKRNVTIHTKTGHSKWTDHSSAISTITKDKILSFNVGYLILQRIYNKSGLPAICKNIKKENLFDYDLDSILSRLVYGRILFPYTFQTDPPFDHLMHSLCDSCFYSAPIISVTVSLSFIRQNFSRLFSCSGCLILSSFSLHSLKS